jgi:mannose-6-phosphate isomerase-like protein (cupin superfamily)
MANEKRQASVRNIAEVPWKEYPDHHGGALSKPLVTPENAGAQHLDYRISMYQPMAYVKLHKHKVQEQIYHVLDGEGLMDIGAERRVVRRHDVIYLPPGVEHAIQNSGLVDLVFLVVTTPPTDDGPAG